MEALHSMVERGKPHPPLPLSRRPPIPKPVPPKKEGKKKANGPELVGLAPRQHRHAHTHVELGSAARGDLD